MQHHADVQASKWLLSRALYESAGVMARSLPGGSFNVKPGLCEQHVATLVTSRDSNREDSFAETRRKLPLALLLCPPQLKFNPLGSAPLARWMALQSQAAWEPAGQGGQAGQPAHSKQVAQQKEDAEACDEAVHDYQELRKRLDKLNKPESLKPWYLYVGDLMKGVWSITYAVIGFMFKIPSYIHQFRSMSKEEWAAKKAGWWKTAKHEFEHYKVGTQLLWFEVKISSRLALKSARGKSLTRRERRQLTRTTADVLRLVPMVIILAIPFLELALPVLLRIFPNMLPSTYEDKLKKEEELKRRLGLRLELARFLQDTVAEMAQDISRRKGGEKSVTARDLYDFVKKVRSGEHVSNSDIVKFAKLFNDELTLENLERVQLVSMCQFVGISPFGTDAFLRSRLTSHLGQIKKDDYDIETEGLENLTEDELRAACRARGMRAPFGEGATAFMRARMQDWLDLSLHRGLPTSLLLLSRAFTITAMPQDVSEKKDLQYTKVKETIGVIPEELVTTLSYEQLGGDHDEVEALQRKLQILKREEWLIREELARAEANNGLTDKTATSSATASGAAAATTSEELEDPTAPKTESMAPSDAAAQLMDALKQASLQPGRAVKVSASSSEEERAEVEAAQREQKILGILEALMDLTSNSAVTRERRTFLQLMKTEIERVNMDLAKKSGSKTLVFSGSGLKNTGDGSDDEQVESQKKEGKDKDGGKADGVTKQLTDRVSRMLASIERDIDKVDKKIGSGMRKLDMDNDGVISQQELQDAISFVKAQLSPEEIAVLLERLGSTIKVNEADRLVRGEEAVDAGLGAPKTAEVTRIHTQ